MPIDFLRLPKFEKFHSDNRFTTIFHTSTISKIYIFYKIYFSRNGKAYHVSKCTAHSFSVTNETTNIFHLPLTAITKWLYGGINTLVL